MNDTRKKILALIIFLTAIALFSYLLWRMYQSSQSISQPKPVATSTEPGRLKPSGNIEARPITKPGDKSGLEPEPGETEDKIDKPNDDKRSNKISSPSTFPVIDATVSADGRTVQYYDPQDNKFYRVNDNGEPEAISDQAFYNVKKVAWSPDRSRAILEYPDNTKIIYNFQTKTQISLPKHWQDFQFSPNGDQIAFKSIGFEPENRWLSIMNADGTQAQNLEKLGDNADKATVSWSPNRQIVATFQDGYDYNRKEVFFIGLKHENFKSMTVQGRGFSSQWSPSGNRLLYSVYSDFNDYKPSIWLTEANGDNIGQNLQPLELDTWSEKCSFASETKLYCAVPRTLAAGSGWLPSSAIDSSDDLYLIDLETNNKTLISTPGAYNMKNLIVTKDESDLYFTDQKTGGLYKVPLK